MRLAPIDVISIKPNPALYEEYGCTTGISSSNLTIYNHYFGQSSEGDSAEYFGTGKQTIYVPDFFIQYKTKTGRNMVELVEVKPSNQVSLESAGNSRTNKAHAVLNQVKWQAANAYCKSKGIRFRIVTEKDMFHQGTR